MRTPCYIFDIDSFHNRIKQVKSALNGMPLVYSIKANPFLIPYIPEEIDHLEVCSPGELSICREYKVSPDRIIYSGVMKEAWDIEEALSYGVDIITAESLRHYELIKEISLKTGRRAEILLRLSSGNQFGMSVDDIRNIIKDAGTRDNVHVKGLHYYSGTEKGVKQVARDIARLEDVADDLRAELGFECELLEYGPGLAAECFAGTEEKCEVKDSKLLKSVSPILKEMSEKYHMSIEMGRFLTAPCGTYETSIMDIKSTDGFSYIITDGGMHHLTYYGQYLAMKVPVIIHDGVGEEREYMICGSLCTTADVMVRNIGLQGAKIGDVLAFKRAGAYSVTEAPALFLSRRMPAIYARSEKDGSVMLRDVCESYRINLSGT